MCATELGINFSHIRAKSMTVLNPLQRVDERIMDDADLAGPLLFFFCFGVLLLLASPLSFYTLVMSLVSSGVDSPGSLSLDTYMALGCLAPSRYTRYLTSCQKMASMPIA